MSSIIRIKRSSVKGRKPSTSSITAGELALNTSDGRLFSSNGTSVFEVGANPDALSVGSGGLSIANGAINFPSADGQAGQVLKTDGSGNITFGDATTSVSIEDVSANTVVTASNQNYYFKNIVAEDLRYNLPSSDDIEPGFVFNIIVAEAASVSVETQTGDTVYTGALSTAGQFSTQQITFLANDQISEYDDNSFEDNATQVVVTSLATSLEVVYIGNKSFLIRENLGSEVISDLAVQSASLAANGTSLVLARPNGDSFEADLSNLKLDGGTFS